MLASILAAVLATCSQVTAVPAGAGHEKRVTVEAAPAPLVVITTPTTPTAHTDTTFSVAKGTRLNVSNFGGAITVRAWNRNAVRVLAQHSERLRLWFRETGPNIEVRAHSRRGIPGKVDFQITVPTWMGLKLQGVYSDVSVAGTRGEVTVETIKGDVSVTGGAGLVQLSSMQGVVSVGGARGKLVLSAVNDGVRVTDSEGDVRVEAVNGDVILQRVQSGMLEAVTVNGDIVFAGPLLSKGRYRLATHNGDLMLLLPDELDATFSVSTFNGSFDFNFPVETQDTRRGRRMDFSLGDGSAEVSLESFEGTIQLRRGGLAKLKHRTLREKNKEER